MDDREWPEGTDDLLDEILTDAYGDDEQLWALRQAFEDDVPLPADAYVVGEPVEVVEIDYDGNARAGLAATCRRPDGGEHVVAAWNVAFPEGSEGARYVAAYRRWLGIVPEPQRKAGPLRPRRHEAAAGELDLDAPIELVVLAPKQGAARCRILGTGRLITLRSGEVWDTVPGEIVTVRARKQWRFSGHPFLSGSVEGRRLDVEALGLVPLRLRGEWPWDPNEHYWGEEDEPLEEWAKPIVARGPRPSFEMEQVLPGED
ncbi:MAG: cytoplasmic protein, partial [Candidatus Latescibacteria bacterium]|nr:cytoplasmic protein [Candidatus Latescibacterota bacterium]